MRGVKIGGLGYRGKRRHWLDRRDGTERRERRGLIIRKGKVAIELHDLKEVANDGLHVEENDFAAAGVDSTLQSDEDGHSRARKVIDIHHVQRNTGVLPALHQLVDRVPQGIVAKIIKTGCILKDEDQGVGLLAGVEG